MDKQCKAELTEVLQDLKDGRYTVGQALGIVETTFDTFRIRARVLSERRLEIEAEIRRLEQPNKR